MNEPSCLTTPAPRAGAHRARWAAIGAAVAVSLGAGGFGIANAVQTADPKNVYVAITPCRLADTRPAPENVGPKATPLGAGETWTIQGTGDVPGDCNIPTGISALQLNVTPIGASIATFLTIYPTGSARPLASSLNPTPGEPPTPNAVTATLGTDGKFDVFNPAGSLNVAIDVVGYYDDHRHDSSDISNEPGVSYSFKLAPTVLAGNTTVTSTAIRVPSDGFLVMQATGNFEPASAPDQAVCQLTLGSTTIDFNEAVNFTSAETAGLFQSLNLHRVVPISVANNPALFTSGQVVRLVCAPSNGGGQISSVQLTATFYPTEYEPLGLIIIPFPVDENVDGNADKG